VTGSAEPGASLAGVWWHAHEEDGPGRVVFRRTDGPPPLSRGRAMLVLHEDGSLKGTTPGPDDRPVPAVGTWTQDGPARVSLQFSGEGHGPSALELEGGDRLVARR
jgi:hypothetical protein